MNPQIVEKRKSRMPANSLFFEKMIPALLVILGVVTIALMLFAAGILLGVITY